MVLVLTDRPWLFIPMRFIQNCQFSGYQDDPLDDFRGSNGFFFFPFHRPKKEAQTMVASKRRVCWNESWFCGNLGVHPTKTIFSKADAHPARETLESFESAP
jgi:hypothetical protein